MKFLNKGYGLNKIFILLFLISTVILAKDDYTSLLKSLKFTQKISELDLKDGKQGKYLKIYDKDPSKTNETYFVLKSIFIDQCKKANGTYKFYNSMKHTKNEKVKENFVITSGDVCFDKKTKKPKYDIFKKQVLYKNDSGKNYTHITVGNNKQALFDLNRLK